MEGAKDGQKEASSPPRKSIQTETHHPSLATIVQGYPQFFPHSFSSHVFTVIL